MFERILVPLDGSNAAEIVLPYAEEIAARAEAEILLVSVSEHTVEERDTLYRSYLERIEEQVQRRLKERQDGVEVKSRIEVLFGKPANEILRYADEANASLISMASRGRSGHGPWLLGNIAAKVLRATDKPVLLVRTPADKAAIEGRRLIGKILLPLDGSTVGEAAIPNAEGLARLLDAELILYQAIEPAVLVVGEHASSISSAIYREDEERREMSARAYLEGVSSALRDKGISSVTAVSMGTAADQIIACAETHGADLIAMSTHGRSGIGRWVFGSVTDKVLHAGDTAVLTVRAAKA